MSGPAPQENEQEILDELFSPAFRGLYVDVGASWPLECSNTYFLYQRGWRGLLIEPQPEIWPVIQEQRPEDWLYRGGASNQAGKAQLRIAGACSSLEESWPIEPTATLEIAVEPLRDILQRYPFMGEACQLCSIDVEGHEKQVLEGIDFGRFRPRVFVLESLKFQPNAGEPLEPLWPQWESILLDHGYRFYRATTSGMNRFYARKFGA